MTSILVVWSRALGGSFNRLPPSGMIPYSNIVQGNIGAWDLPLGFEELWKLKYFTMQKYY
jgi:hypothetical protein